MAPRQYPHTASFFSSLHSPSSLRNAALFYQSLDNENSLDVLSFSSFSRIIILFLWIWPLLRFYPFSPRYFHLNRVYVRIYVYMYTCIYIYIYTSVRIYYTNTKKCTPYCLSNSLSGDLTTFRPQRNAQCSRIGPKGTTTKNLINGSKRI